ncbi:serine/threonine-protein kinase SBK1-like [Ascaphus truei]|uniref:serine/threonine-protein kinase SBK1-like n=1 Tax=Ascaphus truei TaxID=8439 RepID=UPI003F59A6F6
MASNVSDIELILEGLVTLTSQSLQHTELEEHFHVIKELGRGSYGSVMMVKDKNTDKMMALKLLDKKRTTQRGFLMEFSVSFFLSSHPNVIGSYGLAFQTCEHFVFAQELSPVGDLLSLIQAPVGIPEAAAKRCAVQISSALEFMESKGLVHRDIKPDNILVFDKECHCIKVSDFGLTHLQGTAIRPLKGKVPYMSPELCQLAKSDTLEADCSIDVWAFGVVLFCLLTGEFPWRVALPTDQRYSRFADWQNSPIVADPPSPWNRLTTTVLKMFRTLLAIDPKERRKATEVLNYTGESWKTDIPHSSGICLDDTETEISSILTVDTNMEESYSDSAEEDTLSAESFVMEIDDKCQTEDRLSFHSAAGCFVAHFEIAPDQWQDDIAGQLVEYENTRLAKVNEEIDILLSNMDTWKTDTEFNTLENKLQAHTERFTKEIKERKHNKYTRDFLILWKIRSFDIKLRKTSKKQKLEWLILLPNGKHQQAT